MFVLVRFAKQKFAYKGKSKETKCVSSYVSPQDIICNGNWKALQSWIAVHCKLLYLSVHTFTYVLFIV